MYTYTNVKRHIYTDIYFNDYDCKKSLTRNTRLWHSSPESDFGPQNIFLKKSLLREIE